MHPYSPHHDHQGNKLDELLNPFAALGFDSNSGPPKSPTFTSSGWANNTSSGAPTSVTGAGWVQPSSLPQAAPQPFQGMPMQQSPQLQNWGSAYSAFQPPQPQFNSAAGITSPAFSVPGSPVHFVTPSPALGCYSPTSPAFASGSILNSSPLQPGSLQAISPARLPNAQRLPVSETDLSLFTSSGVKAAPEHPIVSPPPAVRHSLQQANVVSAPNVTPQSTNGWDNDDFGISWEETKKTVPPQEAERSAVETRAEVPMLRPLTEVVEKEELSQEGNILARISVRTLIVKEWKQTFWLITGGKLLLYRSKEDYLYNPIGVMVKKDVPLRDNLRCSEVTCKPYKGYGDLYHFTLEEILDYGPSLIAKFASTKVHESRNLRKILISHIISERKRRTAHFGTTRPTSPTADTPSASAQSLHPGTPQGRPEDDKYARWGRVDA